MDQVQCSTQGTEDAISNVSNLSSFYIQHTEFYYPPNSLIL